MQLTGLLEVAYVRGKIMQIFPNLKNKLMHSARLAFGFLRLNVLQPIFLHNKKLRFSHAHMGNGRARCWFLAME